MPDAYPDSAPPHGTTAQHAAVGVLALGLVLLGLYTLQSFLPALAWAGIFAIVLWPWFRAAEQRLGVGRRGTLLPLGFTAVVALVFIVPVFLVGLELAGEFHSAEDWARGAQRDGIAEPAMLHHAPAFQAQIDGWWQQNLADPGSARALLERVTHGRAGNAGRTLGALLVHRVSTFAFTLMALFFLFKDGDRVAAQMRRAALRAFGPGGERVGLQMVASVHGTVSGLVLVGLGEGVALGIVFALAGVPHATALGALSAVAAMIPFAAWAVIGLAALLLAAGGSYVAAVVVAVACLAVTFSADHFIRPALIGGATKLPFLWVLLGILGGVEVWGLLGLFIGPAIMAALILLWREWAGART